MATESIYFNRELTRRIDDLRVERNQDESFAQVVKLLVEQALGVKTEEVSEEQS